LGTAADSISAAIIALAFVGFSDPFYKRLSNPGDSPVFSTLAVSVFGACATGAAWWFLEAWPLGEPRVHLEWRPHPDVLAIAIVSDTTQTLRDVWVDVLDIRKRSAAGTYVEVPEIHGGSQFEKFSISAGILSDVYPDRPIVVRFVGMTPLFEDKQSARPTIWRVVTRNGDDVLAALEIPTPGIWRVTFGEANVARQLTPHLYFEWGKGRGASCMGAVNATTVEGVACKNIHSGLVRRRVRYLPVNGLKNSDGVMERGSTPADSLQARCP
jgi:hypothetical protein